RNDHVRRARAELRLRMLGPDGADDLGQRLARTVLQTKDHVAKETIIRAEPQHAVKGERRVPAALTAILHADERADGPAAARAAWQRIVGQRGAAAAAQESFAMFERPAAEMTERRVDEVQQARSGIAAEGGEQLKVHGASGPRWRRLNC